MSKVEEKFWKITKELEYEFKVAQNLEKKPLYY